mmetsp:Transcript_18839/g.52211  ORF Transcript_18839/g.52211 Transcript_18839/m.52211 type:complete len:229 (-) Transcript_18839:38-724(-)
MRPCLSFVGGLWFGARTPNRRVAAAAGKGFGSKPAPKSSADKTEKEAEKQAKVLSDLWDIAYSFESPVQDRIDAYKKALAALRKTVGQKESADYARICSNLGSAYLEAGKHEKAAKRYKEAEDTFMKISGTDSVEVAACRQNLAKVRRQEGKLAEAEALIKSAMHIYSADLDSTHVEYVQVLRSLMNLYHEAGMVDQMRALQLEERRVAGMAAKLGKKSADGSVAFLE